MLEHIIVPIRRHLDAVEEILRDRVISNVPLATEVVRYAAAAGGKRIRPIVFLLAARLAGAPSEPLAPVAAAVELIHAASLMHDDVVDDACMRRGAASTRAKWGNQISVLVGDFAWCSALRLMVEIASPRLLRIMAEAVATTAEGELMEITRQNDHDLDRQTYRTIIAGKTGALFAACGEAAGALACVPERLVDALRNYAFNVGMAFQLADDVLDYDGDALVSGKTPGTDLKEGRRTLPLIVALERAAPHDARRIRTALIARGETAAEFADIADIVRQYGGVEEARRASRTYVAQATGFLDVFKPSIERESLALLAEYAAERNS